MITRVRVLIASDHDATRTGMRLALAEAAHCDEVDDEAAVTVAVREHPDVCVVSNVRTAAEITSKVPGATVVVMTDRIDEDECLAAIYAGASGYVSDQIDPSRLPYVISDVMHGQAAVPRALVGRLVSELRGRERRRHLEVRERPSIELTERESQMVEALRRGLSTRQIAQGLGISEVTVRRHISGVHRKLGVRKRADLLHLLSPAGASPPPA
jgi:two-component system, NarL family, nitrate/nitrite response regulator NarL